MTKTHIKKINTNTKNMGDLCTKFSKNNINNTINTLDAIIYCRISTPNQIFGTSLDSQKLLCQEYCKKNNFNIKSTLVEIKSAQTMNKQEELYTFINSNENLNLIVYDPSRLSRNLKDYVDFMDKCKTKNITIHFVQDELVSSNNSDCKKILSGVIDGETESRNIGLRVKRSITYRKSRGIYKSSIPKYGYLYNKKLLFVNTEEQQIIKLIQNLYWGSSIDTINKMLLKITGEPHELYFITAPEKQVKTIQYGNMRIIDIVHFLNSIPISKRNKSWNSAAISKIVNQTN